MYTASCFVDAFVIIENCYTDTPVLNENCYVAHLYATRVIMLTFPV